MTDIKKEFQEANQLEIVEAKETLPAITEVKLTDTATLHAKMRQGELARQFTDEKIEEGKQANAMLASAYADQANQIAAVDYYTRSRVATISEKGLNSGNQDFVAVIVITGDNQHAETLSNKISELSLRQMAIDFIQEKGMGDACSMSSFMLTANDAPLIDPLEHEIPAHRVNYREAENALKIPIPDALKMLKGLCSNDGFFGLIEKRMQRTMSAINSRFGTNETFKNIKTGFTPEKLRGQ